MAGTYSQIYVRYVFTVKGKENVFQKPGRDEVFKYMAGIESFKEILESINSK